MMKISLIDKMKHLSRWETWWEILSQLPHHHLHHLHHLHHHLPPLPLLLSSLPITLNPFLSLPTLPHNPLVVQDALGVLQKCGDTIGSKSNSLILKMSTMLHTESLLQLFLLQNQTLMLPILLEVSRMGTVKSRSSLQHIKQFSVHT